MSDSSETGAPRSMQGQTSGAVPPPGLPGATATSPVQIPDNATPDRILPDWLPRNDDPVRPTMTLSTLGVDGYPDARTVLLSEYDESGFFFHTDSRSRKIVGTASPRAALTLLGPGRQLVIQGDASIAPAEEAERVYARRSRYLQILAWLNTPEFAALPLAERIARWAAFDAEHPEGTLTPPDTWVGYRVTPIRLTFWEGRPDTAGRRTEFTRPEATPGAPWTRTLLPG
ncbi:pyridoxamine 5'-phosphate oxidase family protein [Herbiconiux sp.]|uniref:pyridoxine/pyridoxamine 5'-phosphate oxidase n=1 Tax=Herbiconiux sp. TaxID=1871186 RepID=UPI0025C3A507|nr:pyridoxamine 5'-phosphate oxidase family protein [Herbiconiux sp.]